MEAAVMTLRRWAPSIAAAFLAAGCFEFEKPEKVETGSLACDGGRYDPATELCWQHPVSDSQYDWQGAIDYCAGLELGGKEDWRLPTLDVLLSLLDNCEVNLEEGYGQCSSCYESDACRTLFDGDDGDDGYNGYGMWPVWSSTSCDFYTTCTWVVDLNNGGLSPTEWVSSSGARCVRGGNDVDTETETGTDTDTDITGLGELCTQYGAECGGFEANVCVYDPMYADYGVCTVTGCLGESCPLGYACCDCSDATYFFEDLCAPDGMVEALSLAGCVCG
jgi:hypothetical protein